MANEIGVRLTGDNTAFRAMLSQSADQAAKFGGDIAGKVGGKLFELRDVSSAIATALGLNLNSIADNLARTISGVSKETEEALKSLEQISAQVADANIRNARALLTEEQRYQLNLQERDRLIRQIADNEAKTAVQIVAQKRDELRLAEKIAEVQAFEIKQAEERAKRSDEILKMQQAGNEKQLQAQLAILDADGRIELLRESIVGLQATLASGALEEKNARQLTVLLADRQNQLAAEEAKQRAAAAERGEKERARQLDAGQKLAKLKFDELSNEEKIEVITQNIATLTGAIAEARASGIPAEEYEVELYEQKKQLAEQIAIIEARRAPLVDEATQAILRQEKAYAALLDRVRQIDRKGTEIEGQSTTALEGLRDRLKSQLTQAQADRFGERGGVGQIGGAPKSPFEYAIEQELRNVEREITERRNIGNFANRFGEDAARSQFGDTLTDRALRDLKTDTERTAIAIQDIQQRLAQVFIRK